MTTYMTVADDGCVPIMYESAGTNEDGGIHYMEAEHLPVFWFDLDFNQLYISHGYIYENMYIITDKVYKLYFYHDKWARQGGWSGCTHT